MTTETSLQNEFQDFLHNVLLETLTDREKKIALLRMKELFGFDVNKSTLDEISDMDGCGVQRIRQIIQKIKRKIKHKLFIINQKIKDPQVIIKYIEKKDDEAIDNLPIVYKPIEVLGDMSVRVSGALHGDGINTVQNLIDKTDNDIMRLPNIGRKSLNEIKEILRNNGLELRINE